MAGAREPLITSTGGAVSHVPEPLSYGGIRIVFRDLEYLLPSNLERGKTATVLHRMSGYFNAGEMTTIMGPSGCGKSMMMDVLAGRRTKGKINGIVTYAGTLPTQMFLRRITGYVEQFGTLIENLTVYEMLMYTAELKRPLSESYQSKKNSVNDLISKMALEKCRNTKIGNPQLDRGISGGQAKRVNIGIALITNPKVLYMDEPISGLDSYTSNEVMGMVKKLVSDGITLIATLHSPTPYTFNLFDRIFLLLRGHIVYFGRRDRAIAFFEPITPAEAISADSDAEWLTDVIVKADAIGKAGEFAEYYENSPKKTEALESINTTSEPPLSEDILKELSSGRATVTPSWFAIKTYLKYRTFKNLMDSTFWTTRVSDKAVLILMVASVYWGLGNDFTVDNFTNITAVFVVWSAFSAFGASVYIPSLYTERQLFYREHRDGLYRVVTYLIVKLIEEICLMAVIGFVMSLIVWYAVELKGNFLVFYLAFLGNFCCALACAFLFTYLGPNIDAAVGGLATYMTTVIMFCGFYIRVDDMPNYLAWYSKISFIKYSFGSTLINEFESCDEAKNLRIPSGTDPTEVVGVLEYFGMDTDDKYEFLGYIYLFFVGFALLAWLPMQYIRHEKH